MNIAAFFILIKRRVLMVVFGESSVVWGGNLCKNDKSLGSTDKLMKLIKIVIQTSHSNPKRFSFTAAFTTDAVL